jgi:hypothetical protein
LSGFQVGSWDSQSRPPAPTDDCTFHVRNVAIGITMFEPCPCECFLEIRASNCQIPLLKAQSTFEIVYPTLWDGKNSMVSGLHSQPEQSRANPREWLDYMSTGTGDSSGSISMGRMNVNIRERPAFTNYILVHSLHERHVLSVDP